MAAKRRYPSDLTDRQWAMVEPLLPQVKGKGPGGRPLEHPRREIVNAILYVTRQRLLVAHAAHGLPAVADGLPLFRRLA